MSKNDIKIIYDYSNTQVTSNKWYTLDIWEIAMKVELQKYRYILRWIKEHPEDKTCNISYFLVDSCRACETYDIAKCNYRQNITKRLR